MIYNHKEDQIADAIGVEEKKFQAVREKVKTFIIARQNIQYISELIELLDITLKDLSDDEKVLFTYFLHDYGQSLAIMERTKAEQIVGELVLSKFKEDTKETENKTKNTDKVMFQ